MSRLKTTLIILSSLTLGTFIGTILGLQWSGEITINANWMLGLEIVTLIVIMFLVTMSVNDRR